MNKYTEDDVDCLLIGCLAVCSLCWIRLTYSPFACKCVEINCNLQQQRIKLQKWGDYFAFRPDVCSASYYSSQGKVWVSTARTNKFCSPFACCRHVFVCPNSAACFTGLTGPPDLFKWRIAWQVLDEWGRIDQLFGFVIWCGLFFFSTTNCFSSSSNECLNSIKSPMRIIRMLHHHTQQMKMNRKKKNCEHIFWCRSSEKLRSPSFIYSTHRNTNQSHFKLIFFFQLCTFTRNP